VAAVAAVVVVVVVVEAGALCEEGVEGVEGVVGVGACVEGDCKEMACWQSARAGRKRLMAM
jgi:hypothetical protein